MAEEIKAEIKEKTGALDSFFKSIGTGSGLCIGVCVGIIILIFIFAFFIALGSNNSSDSDEGQSSTVTQNTSNNNAIADSSQPKTISEQEYIKQYLDLMDVKLEKGYGEYDVPGYSDEKDVVNGTLKNKGDKSLDYVKLTIYFLDVEGNRISEVSVAPINVDSWTDPTAPLKPNYTQDWGYVIQDKEPSDWGGQVEVEITEIEFS